jgi:hypothetical protein
VLYRKVPLDSNAYSIVTADSLVYFKQQFDSTGTYNNILRLLYALHKMGEDNIRMDLQEVGCGCEDWIGLVQYRDTWRALVSAVRNLRVP